MNQVKHSAFYFVLVCASLLITACGGGGTSNSGTANLVNVFITDDLNTNYDAVWVRIHQVELEGPGGSTTVYNSDTGVEVNLRALSDGAPLYKFLGGVTVPPGVYQAAKVTMAKSLAIFHTGATTGTDATFDAAFDHGNGKSRVNVPFTPTLNLAGGANLVIDFDLSQWTLAGGIVTPVIKVGNSQGLSNLNRHVLEDYKGTVGNLAGVSPNFTFTLTLPSGVVVNVSTSNTTVLFSEGASPALANGQAVEVYGPFNPAFLLIQARVVKIEDSPTSGAGEPKVKGLVSAIDELSGTYRVAPGEVRGFLPSGATVKVQTSATTRFMSHSGIVITKAEFFAGLASQGAVAEAEGTYDNTSNILTAAKAKLEIEGANHEPEAKGPASIIDAGAGTLTIAVSEWQGFSFTNGGSLNITTSPVTSYRDADGKTVTAAGWFAAVANGSLVKVHGTYLGTSMLARRLEIKTGGGASGNDPHEIKGYVSNANGVNGTFVVQLISWFGFSSTFGTSVAVQMSPAATYRNDEGDAISKDQFFAALSNGRVAEVDGTFANGTMTGVKGKLED